METRKIDDAESEIKPTRVSIFWLVD